MEWVTVVGGPHLKPRKMKRHLAEHPDVRMMGIHIMGEGQLEGIEDTPRRGRPTNDQKRIKELEAQLAAALAKQDQKPNVNVA